MAEKLKIAIVVSHPIQHFCPQYASIARHPGISLRVMFGSRLGLDKYMDPDFNTEISWGNLQLDQFDHVFLNGEANLAADKKLDAPELEKALSDFNPRIVILYGYFQKLQRRAYKWAVKRGVQLAYISDSERAQKRNPLKEWIKFPWLRTYFSKIRYFLTVGNANETYYRYYGVPASKFISMHFSIDLLVYEKAIASRNEIRSQVRDKYGITVQEIALSVVGKLVPWKSQVDIIDALLLLEEEHIFAHLFILGSGEAMNNLKLRAAQLSKSRVHFPGFVKPEELPGYYAATDIYVHPAMIEPHSLAISEAAYMGCPLIISNRCGSYGDQDDLQPEKNGFVYPWNNIKELSRKIKTLIQDAQTRKEFGAYSHQAALQFQQRSHGGFVDELRDRINAHE